MLFRFKLLNELRFEVRSLNFFVDCFSVFRVEIDAPLVANMIEDGVTPTMPAKQLLKLGYRIAVFPLSGLYSATFAMREVFAELKKTGGTSRTRKMMVTFKDFNKFVDLQKYMGLEKKYS